MIYEKETTRRQVLKSLPIGVLGVTDLMSYASGMAFQRQTQRTSPTRRIGLRGSAGTTGGFQQVAKLIAQDGDRDDEFGWSVAIDGGTAIIGAVNDDDPNGSAGSEELSAGSAYVFERREGGSWSQAAKLSADDGDTDGGFGYSVAIDGGTAIAGKWNEDTAGSAYVFEQGSNWSQTATLTAGHPSRFVVFVAIDGETTIIGSPLDWQEPNGAAYVFERQSESWSQAAKLSADDGDGVGDSEFGWSVAIDEGTAVIGADNDEDPSGNDTVLAYVFERGNESWSQAATLTVTDGDAGDWRTSSVAVDGETAIIGNANSNGDTSGSAYVFERRNGNWSQAAKLTVTDGDADDGFGVSVAIDGDTAIIGALRDEDSNGEVAGSAYVFERRSGGWSELSKLNAADADASDRFGVSVAIDRGTAIIGADADEDPNGDVAGSAYVFERIQYGDRSRELSPEITDIKPVQITANSRVTGSPSYDFPTDPPLISSRPTGILFSVNQDARDMVADDDSVTVTCAVDGTEVTTVEYPKRNDWIRTRSGLFETFVDADTAPAPIVDLPDSLNDISINVSYSGDGEESSYSISKSITEGEDFSTQEPETLKLAIAKLEDPNSDTYGSVTDFGGIVTDIEDRLVERFPTVPEKLTIKSRSAPVSGVLPAEISTMFDDKIIDDLIIAIDQATAYDRLAAEFPSFDFDAALLISPDGYFEALNSSGTIGIHISLPVKETFQPQFAATAKESACPETALHELGHHFLPPNFYSDVAAQRDAGGKIDSDHARTRDRSIEDVALDSPGVVSTGFNLTGDGTVEKGEFTKFREADSTMSYEDRNQKVPDTLMYEKLAEGFTPRPPVQDVTGENNLVLSLIGVLTNTGLEIVHRSTREGTPIPPVQTGDLNVTVTNSNGEKINQETVGTLQYQTSVSSRGTSSSYQVKSIYPITISIPENATTVSLEHDDGATTFAPVPEPGTVIQGTNESGEHESGVSVQTFDAVAGPDGEIDRSEVLEMVRDYANDRPTGGVDLTRDEVLSLVRYYVNTGG